MSDSKLEGTVPAPPPSVLVSRRGFIRLGIAGVGAAWAGVFVQSRLFPRQSVLQQVKPVDLALAELPVGSSKTITYGSTPVVVLRTPESVKAFSLVCTHLGCLVQWQPNSLEFFCPCHDGRFDQFGEVVAGPPPIPLEEIPVRLEGERVIVGEAV